MRLHLALLFLLACLLSCAPADDPGAGGSGGKGAPVPAPGDPHDLRCGPLRELEAPSCDGKGWCWSHPSAIALHVRDGFADPSGGLWLVGEGADPMVWEGEAWRWLPLGKARNLSLDRIRAVGESVWATHADGLLRWSDGAWHPVDTGEGALYPADLWASGPEELWVVGSSVRRWDGERWHTLPTRGGPFTAVFGLGPEQVWVVGTGGVLLRWDGVAFEREDLGIRKNLRAVWGSGPGDLWVAGEAGTLLHWNGAGWRHVPAPSGAAFTSLAGLARDEVLATGFDATTGRHLLIRWNGSSWSALPLPVEGRPRRVWSDPAGGKIWIGGDQGLLLSWDGTCFRSSEAPAPASVLALSPAGDWAVGERGAILHRVGEAWSRIPGPTNAHLRAVWSRGGKAFAVGDGGTFLHGDAGGMELFPFPAGDLLAVAGSDTQNVWAGDARGRLLHWDGAILRQAPSPTRRPIRSLLVFPDEAWAAAGEAAGELLRFREGRWRVERRTGGSPLLFGSGPSDLWLLSQLEGKAALLEHWDGESWRVVPQEGPAVVRAIATEGEGTWVVQQHGVLHHHDGLQWSASFIEVGEVVALAAAEGELWLIERGAAGDALLHFRGPRLLGRHEAPERLHALWSARAGEAWVAGAKGTLARWTEEGFDEIATETEADFHALTGDPTGTEIWAAGDRGLVLHFRQGSWQRLPAGTEFALNALVAFPEGRLLAAGRRGTLLHWENGAWEKLPAPSQEDLHLVARQGEAIWLGGEKAGLFRWSEGRWEKEPLPFEPRALAAGAAGVWVGGAGAQHLLHLGSKGEESHGLGVAVEAHFGASAGPGAAWLAGEEALLRIRREGGREAHLLPAVRLRGLAGGEAGAWAFGATGILRFAP